MAALHFTIVATVVAWALLAHGEMEMEDKHPNFDHEDILQDDHTELYGDGPNEEKATCKICTEIIVPALDEAIFKSTEGENWKDFIHDVVHALPQKYRYDIENHEVVDHDAAKHGDPCAIVTEQVHHITYDPLTHASVMALAHMFHTDERTKSHLKRLATHTLCHCADDIKKEDGEFHELLLKQMTVTDTLQHQHDMFHPEVDHSTPQHEGHKQHFDEKDKVLTKQELEEIQWQEDQERHERREHGDHHGIDGMQHPEGEHANHELHGDQFNQMDGDGPRGGFVQGDQGEDRGDHELNLEGLGMGHHGEL